jgi:hypothetical protein
VWRAVVVTYDQVMVVSVMLLLLGVFLGLLWVVDKFIEWVFDNGLFWWFVTPVSVVILMANLNW